MLRVDMAGRRASALVRHGLDVCDPFVDLRLVEFCLALPDAQFLRHGRTRFLAHRVLDGRLPPQVLQERRRGRQGADWQAAFETSRAEAGQLLARIEASPVAQRLIDLPRLRRLIESPSSGPWSSYDAQDYRFVLTRALSLGSFILHLERGRA